MDLCPHNEIENGLLWFDKHIDSVYYVEITEKKERFFKGTRGNTRLKENLYTIDTEPVISV